MATCNPDDRCGGVVFGVTDGELEMADDYETNEYQRVQAPLGFEDPEDGSTPDQGGTDTAIRYVVS